MDVLTTPKKVSIKKDSMAKDEMLKFVMSSEKYLKELNKLLGTKEQLIQIESNIDLEICDIQHYIELSNLNAREGFKAYKKLQFKLEERRAIKDKLSILDSLSSTSTLDNISKVVNRVQDRIDNPEYNIRTKQGEELFKVQCRKGKSNENISTN